MDRRHFLKAGAAAGALSPAALARRAAAAPAPDDRRFYELRTYELRGDLAPGRAHAFFKDHAFPAMRRAGVATVGAFTAESGFPWQSLLVLLDHASAADAVALDAKLQGDAAYAGALRAFEAEAQLPYIRYESRLMRAFAAHPGVEVPPAREGRTRLFEMRTYESRTAATLERKVDMFNQGEITLFRSIGMAPVFFGENVFGTRLPSLTYMVAFDDMAARMKAWDTFRTHPEWQRMSRDPRWNVEGAVTVAHTAFLNPVPFSPIR